MLFTQNEIVELLALKMIAHNYDLLGDLASPLWGGWRLVVQGTDRAGGGTSFLKRIEYP